MKKSTVEVQAGQGSENNYGIDSNEISILKSSNVKAKTLGVTDNINNAICVSKNITISNSTVTAEAGVAGDDNQDSAGISFGTAAITDNATVIASAPGKALYGDINESLPEIYDNAKVTVKKQLGDLEQEIEEPQGKDYIGYKYVKIEPNIKYKVFATVNPKESGKVLLEEQGYTPESKVEIRAVPNDGYEFVNWTENGQQVSTEQNYSFIVIKHRNLVANFKQKNDSQQPSDPQNPSNKVTLTFDSNGGSFVSPITSESAITLKKEDLKTPTKRGSTFVEWNTAKDGRGKKVQAGDVFEQSAVLYAKWNVNYVPHTGGGGSGGGGSYGGAKSSHYSIDKLKTENGSVKSVSSAEKNDVVIVTVVPDKGYETEELVVTDNKRKEITVKETKESGKYEFTMPASNVTIKATFKKIVTVPEVKSTDASEETLKSEVPNKKMQTIVFTMHKAIFSKIIDGKTIQYRMDAKPFLKDGRVMLPLRYVAEALGMKVQWNAKTATVILNDKNSMVEVPVKSNKMIVNGVEYRADVEPILEKGRTYLSISNLTKALGLKNREEIKWDNGKKEVTITKEILAE